MLSSNAALQFPKVETAQGHLAGASANLYPLQILNRLGYGPRPGDLASVAALGVERYVEQQLHPGSTADSSALRDRLQSLTTLRANPLDLFMEFGPRRAVGRDDLELVKARRQRAKVILDQLRQAQLWRALESPRQLEELLVDFWFNHFNVFADKGLVHLWVGAYAEQAIRPHVLGRFRDLLDATARHPAMLFYLDNWQNTAPGSPGARNQFKGLNENYARELLELHTLGVDGGYTQRDVQALARILTGWGLRRREGRADESVSREQSGFHFAPQRHDFGDKQFLGRTITGRGIAEIEEALDLLAAHPATAKHICCRLAQFFVADQPASMLVDRLVGRYHETRGDLRAVMTALLASSEFRAGLGGRSKFKTPLQFVVSAVRASGRPVDHVEPLEKVIQRLGQPLFSCQTPDGYQTTQSAWLSPDAMLARLNFATALGSGRLPLTDNRTDLIRSHRMDREHQLSADADALLRNLGELVSDKTRQIVASVPPPLRTGLVLGSPEFMYR